MGITWLSFGAELPQIWFSLGLESTNYLWNKKGEALEPVVQVWNLSLRPLLEQYLAGLDATARNTELDRLSKVLLKPSVAE